MAIKLDPEQIKQLKDQLAEANRNSHFVIISAFSKKEHSNIDMVTDWRNYLNMKENNGDNFDFHIIRDILPITTNWFIGRLPSRICTRLPPREIKTTRRLMIWNSIRIK